MTPAGCWPPATHGAHRAQAGPAASDEHLHLETHLPWVGSRHCRWNAGARPSPWQGGRGVSCLAGDIQPTWMLTTGAGRRALHTAP